MTTLSDRLDQLTGGQTQTFGFEKRGLFPGERSFFKQNPTIAGMAAEDDKIITNPFSSLSDAEKQAVIKNEAVRLFLRQRGEPLDFDVTPEQQQFFKGTGEDFSTQPEATRATIIGRILSGDPSAQSTAEQEQAARQIQTEFLDKRIQQLLR